MILRHFWKHRTFLISPKRESNSYKPSQLRWDAVSQLSYVLFYVKIEMVCRLACSIEFWMCWEAGETLGYRLSNSYTFFMTSCSISRVTKTWWSMQTINHFINTRNLEKKPPAFQEFLTVLRMLSSRGLIHGWSIKYYSILNNFYFWIIFILDHL